VGAVFNRDSRGQHTLTWLSLSSHSFCTIGVQRITQHPVLFGLALWAFTHLLATGDLASLVLFGSLLGLVNGGDCALRRRDAFPYAIVWGFSVDVYQICIKSFPNKIYMVKYYN